MTSDLDIKFVIVYHDESGRCNVLFTLPQASTKAANTSTVAKPGNVTSESDSQVIKVIKLARLCLRALKLLILFDH